MPLLDKLMNDKDIRKSFETGDFSSGVGLLEPEQSKEFLVLTKRYSTLLQQVRMVPMKQRDRKIEKSHFSKPITRSASENTLHPSVVKPYVNQVELRTKKLISNWEIDTEVLQENIQQYNYEELVMQSLIEQIAQDLEHLAIMGDESITVTPGNEVESLLVANDGWYKKSLSCHVIDADGAPLTRGLLASAKRAMPKQYRMNPNMKYIMSDSLVIDWQDLLAGGNAGAVDFGSSANDAIAGSALNFANAAMSPYNQKIIRVPLIPDDQLISSGASASYGFALGTQMFPFKISGGLNDTLIVTSNVGGPITVTFPAPATGKVFDGVEIISILNAALSGIGVLAIDSGEQTILIKSKTLGAASMLTIAPEASGSTANKVLGFPVAGVVSTGAASAGTVADGTFLWLTDPRNLLFGMQDSPRVFSEFEKDYDRLEVVVYNQVDYEIENPDALVLVKNIRKRSFI